MTQLGGSGDALVLIPAPSVAGSWAASEPGEVMDQAIPALEQLLPGTRSRIREARLVRLPDRVTVPAPGHFRRLAERSARAEPSPVRLAMAGDWCVAPTVEGAVRSGLTAARRIAPTDGSVSSGGESAPGSGPSG